MSTSSSEGTHMEEKSRERVQRYRKVKYRSKGQPSSYKNCEEMLRKMNGETPGSRRVDNFSSYFNSGRPAEKFHQTDGWASNSAKSSPDSHEHEPQQHERELYSGQNGCHSAFNGEHRNSGDCKPVILDRAREIVKIPRRRLEMMESNERVRRIPGGLKRKRENLEDGDYERQAVQRTMAGPRPAAVGSREPEHDDDRTEGVPSLFNMGAGFGRGGPPAINAERIDPDVRNGRMPWDGCADFQATISLGHAGEPNSHVVNHGINNKELESKLQLRKSRWGTQLDDFQCELNSEAVNDVNLSLDEVVGKRKLTYKRKGLVEWDQCSSGAPNGHSRKDDCQRLETRSNPREIVQIPRERPVLRNPEPQQVRGEPRPIVIDGSNVGYAYGEDCRFECKGIRICVDYFLNKGFNDVTVVIPQYRMHQSRHLVDGHILRQLESEQRLMVGFGRQMNNNKWVFSYDDRMIVEVAHKRDGIIVSNDRFRDLLEECEEWYSTIRHRVLPFRFILGMRDEIIFPRDPMGRHGPSLDEFLRF